MRSLFLLLLLTSLYACSSAKIPVDELFATKATKMPVKGLDGWMVNQKLSFGNYETSAVKRGWDFLSAVQYTRFFLRPEEMLLQVLNVDVNNNNLKQKNRFQYTIDDGKHFVEVYATEKFSEQQLVYKSNNPYMVNASKTKKYEYAFTAGIIPQTAKDNEPWSLVLINAYDIAKDTARKLFDRPYVEEEGYATNGKESITIRPLRIDKMTNKKGKKVKILGGSILSGYELSTDDDVVAVIDILDNNIWLHNKLSSARKLVLSAVTSAILLKRMQDVQEDKDVLEN